MLTATHYHMLTIYPLLYGDHPSTHQVIEVDAHNQVSRIRREGNTVANPTDNVPSEYVPTVGVGGAVLVERCGVMWGGVEWSGMEWGQVGCRWGVVELGGVGCSGV